MSFGQLYTYSFNQFPDRRDHDERWLDLAKQISAERNQITDDPAAIQPPASPGELIVIGSGIEAVGFTSSDEILIREADHVFFCVADPATSVWLKGLRPDAYDLYVLYDDTKLRYLTYMQMTEAILHFVRKGQKVVAIYYGHPGIFVLSTHRAIRIARREGHRAVMRAGISALDMLCADLGVDPSQPGMQVFEATDMLIRDRRPDPSLHLVLWQVGLIGELGYRRRGYVNSGFSILLDFLEEVYGPDHTVINYVGSRYPGIKPITDVHTITTLRNPDVQATVTGISTFYLEPKVALTADESMLKKLGLLKPGQTTKAPTSPLREIDHYGPREMKAFDDFANFRVPSGYHWQEDTAAAHFILALREDGALRDLYARDPAAAVASWSTTDLGPHERTLLARGDAGAMQIAAKGIRGKANPEVERMIRTLLTRKSVARELLRTVRRAEFSEREQALEQWGAKNGYTVDWSTVHESLNLMLYNALYPWTGFYLTPERQISLFLLGRPGVPPSDRIYLNGRVLHGARYEKGRIKWRAEDGNASSGYLQTDCTPRGTRRLIGAVWPAGESLASHHQLVALEHRLPSGTPIAAITGQYHVTDVEGRTVMVSVRPDVTAPGEPRMRVEIDDQSFTGTVKIGTSGFELDALRVPFTSQVRDSAMSTHLCGEYVVRAVSVRGSKLHRFSFDDKSLTIDGKKTEGFEVRGSRASWRAGTEALAKSEVTLLLDPITLRPMLFGTGRAMNGDDTISLTGMVPIAEVDAKKLSTIPDFGIADWAWEHLTTIATDASRKGGLFLWHGWEKSFTNLQRVRAVLREVQS